MFSFARWGVGNERWAEARRRRRSARRVTAGLSGGSCEASRSLPVAVRPWRRGATLVLRVLLEGLGQLRASGDVEFAVGAAEVHLDGLDRQVQLCGDLAVAEARGGAPGDAQLRRGERVAVLEVRGPESYPGGGEL